MNTNPATPIQKLPLLWADYLCIQCLQHPPLSSERSECINRYTLLRERSERGMQSNRCLPHASFNSERSERGMQSNAQRTHRAHITPQLFFLSERSGLQVKNNARHASLPFLFFLSPPSAHSVCLMPAAIFTPKWTYLRAFWGAQRVQST